MLNTHKITIIAALLALLLAGCGGVDRPPLAESDSSQKFRGGSEIPVDDVVYTIKGKVVADLESLVQQDSPGYTRTYVSEYGTSYTYMPPVVDGKGFLRVLVEMATPETALAPVGNVVILKTTDTKIRAVLPGDFITLKCRAQFEAVAAVRDHETFNAEKLGTWELDYCRMPTPVVEVRTGR